MVCRASNQPSAEACTTAIRQQLQGPSGRPPWHTATVRDEKLLMDSLAPARLAYGLRPTRRDRFHSAAGASKATPTSLESFPKPSISTSIVHAPSARSAKEYRPFSSVVVNSFLSPLLAVTVAPGTESPPDLTVPWCSAAMRPVAVIQTAKSRPR